MAGVEETIYLPAPEVAFRRIEGQTVMVHTLRETLITLNETGTAIWESLDGRTVAEVADELVKRFEVSAEQAMDDVLAFLDEMTKKELVQIRSNDGDTG